MSDLLKSLKNRPRVSRTMTFPYDPADAERVQFLQGMALAEHLSAGNIIADGAEGAEEKAAAAKERGVAKETEASELLDTMVVIEMRVASIDRLRYDVLVSEWPPTDEQKALPDGDSFTYDIVGFPLAVAKEAVSGIRVLGAVGEDGERTVDASTQKPTGEEIEALWASMTETDQDRLLATVGDLMMNVSSMVEMMGKG